MNDYKKQAKQIYNKIHRDGGWEKIAHESSASVARALNMWSQTPSFPELRKPERDEKFIEQLEECLRICDSKLERALR